MDKAQFTFSILTALTPTVAILLATLIQRQDVRDSRGEVNGLCSDMQQQRLSLRNQVHAGMLMIYERVARVEAKQE